MRHRNAGRKLSRNGSSRRALFRNLVTSLLRHEQVRTTEAKAKELRPVAEKVITLARRAPSLDGLEGEALQVAKAARVHLIRQAGLIVNDKAVLTRLFTEYSTRYASRPGGYIRIVKMGARPGDNAPMALVALVHDGQTPEGPPVPESDAV
jgi:large subunit ribosomal protein L17